MVTADEVPIEFRVLGSVEADRSGQPLALGGPRQRALLALLLVNAGRAVSTDALIDGLWADSRSEAAEVTLRSYVSRLRRALGRGAPIEGGPAGYTLQVAPDQIDAARFERLVREGEAALARGAVRRAGERLRQALSLWRGLAFAGVEDAGHALQAETERLQEVRLRAHELRLDADLRLGHAAELVDELERLVAEHPFRERLWGQLMLALYRAGRQAHALAAYQRARSLLADELGLEPGRELEQLQIAILRHEVPRASVPEERHNLPAPLTSFIGRERELTQAARLLDETRLLTLTGVGGVGKTRLAIELGRRLVSQLPGGVFFVDLAPISEPALVPHQVAGALEVTEQAERTLLDQLSSRLGTDETLVVLDNCEHLIEAVAELVAGLLPAAPDLRVLATSREPLGLTGEVDLPLPPLSLPVDAADPEAIRASEAVALFLERARAARPSLAADDATLLTAARITSELDGLPLALELAAARAKALSLRDIAERLRDRFRFLVSWRRLVTARHRTLREAIDWSYGLLKSDLQAAFARLSVFAGGFALDAAAAVGAEGDEGRAVELLARLADASLIVVEEDEDGTRYRLLETIREYAAERLEQSPEAEELRRRHAEYYFGVADAANLSLEALDRGPQRHELVVAEEHNVRAAIAWATNSDPELGLRLMHALENFWITRDPGEGARRYGLLLERVAGVDPLLLARAYRDYGSTWHTQRDLEHAQRAYERAQELFRDAGDARGMAEISMRFGMVAFLVGDPDRGWKLLEDSLESFRRLGYTIGELQALSTLGHWEFERGNPERGEELTTRSLELARNAGWTWWEANALGELADRALETGRIDAAEDWARELLALAWKIEDRINTLYGLALLAWAAAENGALDRAGALWAAIEAEEARQPVAGSWVQDRERYAVHIAVLPRPDVALALDAAVDYALSPDSFQI